MQNLIVLAVVGFFAQLIDGSLGMGYGVTSTSMLLMAGLSPAAASASVHLAKVGTGLASGISHWRFKNIDKRLAIQLGVSGGIGGFAGALLLSTLSTTAARPLTTFILFALGVYILARFTLRPPPVMTAPATSHTSRFLLPLGVAGGFVDATGGGGWGPVTTSTLLGAGKTAPRTVIGSVSMAEMVVSLSASIGFLVGLGHSGAVLGYVAALLAGGLLAAPVAAWAVSRIAPRMLGSLVGGFIILTNLNGFLSSFGIGGPRWAYYGVGLVAWITCCVVTWRRRQTSSEISGMRLPEDAGRAASLRPNASA